MTSEAMKREIENAYKEAMTTRIGIIIVMICLVASGTILAWRYMSAVLPAEVDYCEMCLNSLHDCQHGNWGDDEKGICMHGRTKQLEYCIELCPKDNP